MSIKTVINGALNRVSENSPQILTGMAVAGVITTSVYAVKGALHAQRILDELDREHGVAEEPKERMKDVLGASWLPMLPAVIMGATTIGCIVASQHINGRRYAVLVSAYGVTEKTLHKYQEQLEAVYGEKGRHAVEGEIARADILENPPKRENIISTGRGDTLFRDSISGRDFTSTVEYVQQAVNAVNAKVINNMYASMNDFYDHVGLPFITIGDEFGFRSDNMMEVRFDPIMTELGQAALVIQNVRPPKRGYHREH